MTDRQELHKFIVERFGGLDSDAGFRLVWGWMRKDADRWDEFLLFVYDRDTSLCSPAKELISCKLIDNPSKFIDMVGEFLKQEA